MFELFRKNSIISCLAPFESPPAGADCLLPFIVLFSVSYNSNALMTEMLRGKVMFLLGTEAHNFFNR